MDKRRHQLKRPQSIPANLVCWRSGYSSYTGLVEALKVCSEGLQALAGQCSADAEQLKGHVPTGVTGPPHQETSMAVGDAYAAIRSTAATLGGRVQATADNLAVAATQYSKSDEASGQLLSALRIES